jgi:hypothetical protein
MNILRPRSRYTSSCTRPVRVSALRRLVRAGKAAVFRAEWLPGQEILKLAGHNAGSA